VLTVPPDALRQTPLGGCALALRRALADHVQVDGKRFTAFAPARPTQTL